MKKIITGIGFILAMVNGYSQSDKSNDSYSKAPKAGTSYSYSLKQAIDYAMQNQDNVKNAMIDEELARDKVKEIRGSGLPQINGSVDVKDFVEIPTSLIPAEFFGGPPGSFAAVKFGTQYQAAGGFDASQMLFNAEYFLGLKGSKVVIELSTRALTRTKIETATAVSKAYYNVLVNAERMKLLDANIVRLKKILDDTKAMLDNGFVEKIDYDRLSVTYTNLTAEKEKVERLLNVGNYLLKFQMGMDVNADLTLTDKLEDVKFDTGAAAMPDKFDYSKRIEYGIAETQFKLAKLDLKRQRFSYLPSAFAYGSYSSNAYRSQFDFFDTKQGWYPTALVGATIKVPIFSGGIRHYKNQQSKLGVQKAENNMDAMKKAIDLELASYSTFLTNAATSLENQKKNITLAEDIAKVTKVKYEQGVGTNLEVITAETALLEAQTNYMNALYDAIIAKIDFDKANGNLK